MGVRFGRQEVPCQRDPPVLQICTATCPADCPGAISNLPHPPPMLTYLRRTVPLSSNVTDAPSQLVCLRGLAGVASGCAVAVSRAAGEQGTVVDDPGRLSAAAGRHVHQVR